MDKPQHALSLWITEDDTIIVQYPDNQQIAIPGLEVSRLLSILRSQRPRPRERLLTFNWAQAWGPDYKEAKARGVEQRAKLAEREEREKRARLKRVAKRDAVKEADKILAIVGL